MSMSLETSLRVALVLLGALGIFFFSHFLTLGAIVALSVRFRAWEALALGLCADMVWLPFMNSVPVYTLIAIAVVWLFEPLRTEFLR